MSDSKVILTSQSDDGEIMTESVWATKEGENYRIDNIPFFAPNLALCDLVSAEEDEGFLYFDHLVEPSGHSSIQIIIFNETEAPKIGKKLEEFGCTWEGSHGKSLIAADVPREIPYSAIKKYLDDGENNGLWSYKEACLCHTY